MLFVGHNIPPTWLVCLIYFMNVFPLDSGPVCLTDTHFNQFYQLVAASCHLLGVSINSLHFS